MKTKRYNDGRILIYLIGVVLLAAVFILYSIHALDIFNSIGSGGALNISAYSKLNLNATEADIVMNAEYTPIVMGENSIFAGILNKEGYKFSITNVLNSSNQTNYSVPASIISTVYVMQNAGSAANALQSLINSYNSQQSIFKEAYNSSNYTYRNVEINITYVTSIAVLNYTDYNAYLNRTNNSIAPLPIYQETVLFYYRNILYSIIINGYLKIPSEKTGRALAAEAINNILNNEGQLHYT